jgi:hypothetical protein
MNVNHTPKAKTTKGVRLSKGVKEQKKGPKGPGEARARFLTKDSTWPTTNHGTIRIIQYKKQPHWSLYHISPITFGLHSGVARAVQVRDFFWFKLRPPLIRLTVANEVGSIPELLIIAATCSISSSFLSAAFPKVLHFFLFDRTTKRFETLKGCLGNKILKLNNLGF